MTRTPTLQTAAATLALIAASACADTRSSLTLRGSTPCPPGDGTVETWCDDAGNCELRVVGGPTFSCYAGETGRCMQAAIDAAEACRSGAAATDGGTSGAADVCADLCATCGDERCAGCSDYAEAAREAGCDSELRVVLACLTDVECNPEDTSCTADLTAFSECVCPSLLPAVRQRAEACGRSFDYTCDDVIGGAVALACAPELERDGCAAFDSALCGNF